MKALRIIAALAAVSTPLQAQDNLVVTTKTLRTGDIISIADIAATGPQDEEAEIILSYLVGRSVKRSFYANSSITVDDVEAPKIIERNAIVRVEYSSGLLNLSTNGRALDAGAAGTLIRVMNLSSKSIVTAEVVEAGKVVVK